MLIDHVLINDEIELLAFRMEVLNDKVDLFHVVECGTSHSNEPKKLHLLEAVMMDLEILKPYRDKLRVSTFVPSKPFSYGSIERDTRDFIAAYAETWWPKETHMMSDVDEIPEIPDKIITPSVSVQDNFYYDFSHKWDGKHFGTVFFKAGAKGQELRDLRSSFKQVTGGWHLSCFSGVDKTVNKLNSFSHTEFRDGKTNTKEWVKSRMGKGLDIVDREMNIKLRKVNYRLPDRIKIAYQNFKRNLNESSC